MKTFGTSFLASVVSFTRIPVPMKLEAQAFQAAVWHLPLWGWIYAGLQSLILLCVPWSPDGVVSSGLVLLLPILVSGALHEDGLADYFDGRGAGPDPKKKLAAMKDSQLGSFGALALFFVLGLEWASLWELPNQAILPALVLSQVGARWVSLVLVASLPYLSQSSSRAGDFLPKQGWSLGILYGSFLFVCSFGLLPSDAWTWLSWILLALGLAGGWYLILLREWGAYTGDCLGAAIKVSELIFLLAANALWRF